MLPLKQLYPLPVSSAQQLNNEDDQAKQENENADAIDAVHITDPFIFWTIRIFFLQVEVFRYLSPDSHKNVYNSITTSGIISSQK